MNPLPDPSNVPPALPGDISTLHWIAWQLQQVADSAATASTKLSQANGDLDCGRDAADKFRGILDNPPSQLSQVSSAYGSGASAVRKYAGTIESYAGSWQWNR